MYTGEIAGIVTAICWTATAIFFQQASRRIGSLVVNLLRLILAAVFYSIYSKLFVGAFVPHVSVHAWTYLSISGLIGFVLGDFFLFKSYEYISSKTTMLVFTLSTPIAAVLSWVMLNEHLNFINIVGMSVVLLGVGLVILYRKSDDEQHHKHVNLGVLYAALGAFGQGVGSVFSKIGMDDCDPFVASQVRVLVGVVGFLVVITLMKRWGKVKLGFSDKKGLGLTTLGAFTGPFLGVGLGMVAIKMIPVGVASTLMSTMPVFILIPSVVFLKEKLTFREVIGAVIAVGGIVIFFLD